MARPRSCRENTLIRRVLPAALLVFALGSHAGAASIASAVAFDAEEHAHHCKCGTCRGASCCCGPRAIAQEAPARPAAEPIRAAAGPCLNSAPCGDSGLPGTPAAGPFGKAASLAACGHPMPDAAGRLLPPHARCVLPARRAFRLDDPPESPPA